MSACLLLNIAICIVKCERFRMPKMSGAELAEVMEMIAMLKAEGMK